MEKRVLIAILLCFSVLYGYSFLFPQKPAQAPVANVQQQASSATRPVTADVAPPTAAPSVPSGAPEREVTVDTDLYSVTLSSRGGVIKKYLLKKYKEQAGNDGQPIALVNEPQAINGTLFSTGSTFGIEPALNYALTGIGGALGPGESRTLEFATNVDGVVYTKKFTFHGDSYGIDLDQLVLNRGSAAKTGSLQLVLRNRVVQKPGDGRYETYGSVTLSDNALNASAIKDLTKDTKRFEKDILWTGFNDKYFLNSVLARNNSIAQVSIREQNGFVDEQIASPSLTVAPGQAVTISHKVYFGPKDFSILKQQGNRLEEVIDFGWFSAIAKPLLHTLNYFHKYTGNYGIDIIIITIILKLFFFPLTHKSYKSMKAMQKLQPMMMALKEKHKNDRDALNRAVMELYQTHKVNPIGGCLPMIVQIPVFFALYKALMFSIELRHAPFMLWIQDLSAKDPYYVTPIIMGITMFIQQKMTPTTGMDPMQAKVMLALPVVFTFMFLNFPSGLVLYWLVNNILTIAQQYYINKTVT